MGGARKAACRKPKVRFKSRHAQGTLRGMRAEREASTHSHPLSSSSFSPSSSHDIYSAKNRQIVVLKRSVCVCVCVVCGVCACVH